MYAVMAGLVPATHAFLAGGAEDVDARDEPGHDDLVTPQTRGLNPPFRVSSTTWSSGVIFMRMLSLTVGFVAAFAATGASAQSVDLTGRYNCIAMCRGANQPYITQNGPELNVVTEAGIPSRAWPDWYFPATRIWVDAMVQSAVYTPDGLVIQFDGGTVWRRDIPPPPAVRRRR
jgi:hypothetical protein